MLITCFSLNTSYVTADVTDYQALSEGLHKVGFDCTKPTAWIAEGILEYLDGRQLSSLGHNISKLSADKSRFIGSVLSPEILPFFTNKYGTCLLPWKLPLPSKDRLKTIFSETNFVNIQFINAVEFLEYFPDRALHVDGTDDIFSVIVSEVLSAIG